VAFCYHRLYYGFYNELNGLVKFEKKVAEGGQVIFKPVKFAVAYSLFCNYAKGGIAVFQGDLCGRLAFEGDSVSKGDSVSVVATLFALIYLCCFVLIIVGICCIPCYLCCNICGNYSCSCMEKRRLYRHGRNTLLVACLSLLLSRCINSYKNLSINFGESRRMSLLVTQT
jgi:hypothetical protein